MKKNMTYSETVREARKIIKRMEDDHWLLGDLSLKAVPISYQNGGGMSGSGKLNKWLDEIGWEDNLETFLTMRYCAGAWPRDKRCYGASWSTHKILAVHPERFNLIRPGLKVVEAEALVGRSRKKGRFINARTPLDVIACIQAAGRFIESAGRVSMDGVPEDVKFLVGEAWANLDQARELALESHGMADPEDM